MATDRETCTRRLVYRRFDPITGAKYNILTEKAKKLSEMTQSPQDAEEAVNVRMERNIKIKGDMEKFYGYRTDANPFGIMQEVPASGMGEADSTTGRNESKQKMFELVTSMLLQPIPLVPKKLLQSTGAKV